MCNSRQKYADFAFSKPFPYGLTKKLTARAVYRARKLEVWAASPVPEKGPTDKINEFVVDAMESAARTMQWAAMCGSPAFGFIFDAREYPDVYEPGEDSFLLADTALSVVGGSTGRMLEIGCGSGIISHIIKKHVELDLLAVDINPRAVECAKRNGINAVQSDLFENVEGKFNLIIFNPPYLPDNIGEPDNPGMDRALYGGPTGRELILKFLKDAGEHLNEHGRILIVISTLTDAMELKRKAEEMGYEMDQMDRFENLSTWRLTLQPEVSE